MKKISVLGIDIAKHTFYLCGINRSGKVVLKMKVSRRNLLESVIQSGADLVAIESCGGSHYWARTFEERSLKVKLIAPQFVKPYVKSNKTDAADAEAIAEAASRPTMRFVPVKTVYQQDLQAMHKVRERLIRQRTALSNEIRGLLNEYGIVFNQGFSSLKNFFCLSLNSSDELSTAMKDLLSRVYVEFKRVDEEVGYYDRKLLQIARTHPVAKRIMTVPGIGPICATAIIAAVSSNYQFKNGRQFASWLGLTPREYSSGGKQRLLGISKRGNSYLRKQIVHGARSVVFYAALKNDQTSLWINNLRKRAGAKKTTVACANKIARTVWALIRSEQKFQNNFAVV